MPDCQDRPLRLCFLVAYFHPFESGAERQALAQGVEHVRRGNTVHVLTQSVYGLPTEEEVQGVKVHRWIRPWRAGPLFAPTFLASTVRGLIRLRNDFDLVHTHQALWEAIATGCTLPSWIENAPRLVQPASSGYYGEAQEILRTRGHSYFRRLALNNDAFVAISAEIESEWLSLGVPASKLTRIASGVDQVRFAPDWNRLKTESNAPVRVMFTGRLHPQKNLDLLIEAWPDVSRATGAYLVLVGDGPDRDRLKRKAKELGVGESVAFPGSTDSPAEALKTADLFVLPSLAEGMSNSLLEAMSTGLPCVASDIGGNRDLLGLADAGILVDNTSPEVWANVLIDLIGDRTRRKQLGASARKRVEEEFALERVVDRYLALYRTLLEDKPKKS